MSGPAGHLIDQGWADYTPAQHATWATLFARQSERLRGRASKAYLDGLEGLGVAADAIPDFAKLSELLVARTGWRVVAVPGLVPDEVFFALLADRLFPAGNFIRRQDQLDYIEAPDVFHDVFGHVPMLMHPVFADYMRAYGLGGLRARGLGALPLLARVYWYTVEFGLIREDGALRIYGAGIQSSAAECVHALDDPAPKRIAFDLPRVMRTAYKIDDVQANYFVIEDYDQLLDLARVDFAPLYARLRDAPIIQPGEVLPQDRLL